jgi:lysophospholipase L1-like esterase
MLYLLRTVWVLCAALALSACATDNTTDVSGIDSTTKNTHNITRIYLAADSTVADHTLNDDYWEKRHPVTGWGQKFQPFVSGDNLTALKHLIASDSAEVINKAKGGRSTRTFFEEGRWDEIYRALQPNDVVLIQFGHNDAAVEKHERYVNLAGYKQYLRLFVQQTREKKALPIFLTPVNRNYPWENGQLGNSHGNYPEAMQDVAAELEVALIDLGVLSRNFFTRKGQEYVSKTYFMNIPAGAFSAYPDGLNDNTHFQPEGAEAVARLVFEAMKALPAQ